MDNKLLKGLGKMDFGDQINLLFAANTFVNSRKEGKGLVSSAGAAASDAFIYDVVGFGAMTALGAAKVLPKAMVGGVEGLAKMSRQMSQAVTNAPFVNATFADSQQAYTMRQAGMQMAQASKYNLQQTMLGNEAKYMHR